MSDRTRPHSMVTSRTVEEHRRYFESFTDDVALDSNFANLPEAPRNKEAILLISPALKRAITVAVDGTSLEVKARPVQWVFLLWFLISSPRSRWVFPGVTLPPLLLPTSMCERELRTRWASSRWTASRT